MFCGMQGSASVASGSRQVEAMLLGVAGVVAFSMTLPATKLALHGLQPVFVSLGRALVAAALSAFALEHLTAAHSAVITGLLPAATAVMAVLRAGERPSPTFWLACAAGAGC